MADGRKVRLRPAHGGDHERLDRPDRFQLLPVALFCENPPWPWVFAYNWTAVAGAEMMNQTQAAVAIWYLD
jgi:hypothetical protein